MRYYRFDTMTQASRFRDLLRDGGFMPRLHADRTVRLNLDAKQQEIVDELAKAEYAEQFGPLTSLMFYEPTAWVVREVAA